MVNKVTSQLEGQIARAKISLSRLLSANVLCSIRG